MATIDVPGPGPGPGGRTAFLGRAIAARQHLLWSVLIAIVLGAPVTISLTTRVPDMVETPMPAVPGGGLPWPVEASYMDYPGSAGEHTAVFRLHLGDPSSLARHGQIRILAATYGTAPQLRDATLKVIGTECEFRTAEATPLVNNDFLPLDRQRTCVPMRGGATGDLALEVRFRGPGRVALWTVLPGLPSADPSTLYMSHVQARTGHRPLVHATYIDAFLSSRTSRIALLATTWQLGRSPWWIWSAIAASIAIALIAVIAMLGEGARAPDAQPGARAALISGAAAGSLTLAVTVMYAVMIPPFQAPDEPDHLFTYGNVTGDPMMEEYSRAWARTMNFARIKSDPREHFRASDAHRVIPDPWGDEVNPENVEERSGATFRWWRLIRRVIGSRTPMQTLLLLRLANALLFAGAVCVAVMFVVWCTPNSRSAHLAWFSVLFVPTMPFWAMHVSPSAIAISAYAALAGAVLTLFLDGARSSYAGGLFGLSLGLMLAAGRNVLLTVALVLGLLLGRIVLGSQAGPRERVPHALLFWAGVSLAWPVFWLLATDRYTASLASAAAMLASNVPAPLTLTPSFGGAALVGAGVLAGVAGELLFRRLRIEDRLPSSMARRGWRVVGWLPAVALGLTLAGYAPHVQSIESPAIVQHADDYVRSVFATVLTTVRIADPDFYLSSSFWAGFGWLETRLPDTFSATLILMTAAMWVMLGFVLGRRQDARRLIWLIAIGVGWFTSLFVYARAAYVQKVNLHGRYLVGLYLIAVAIAWSVAMLPDGRSGRFLRFVLEPRRRTFALLALTAGIHAAVWCLLLARYF